TFSRLVSDANAFSEKEGLQAAAAVTNERAGASGTLDGAGGRSQLLSQSTFHSLLNQKSASTLRRIQAQLDRVAPYLLFLWLAGVAFLFVRFVNGWKETRALKLEAEPSLVEWQPLVDDLARRVRVSRTVRLCESALVEVPTVIGWLRPLILFPAKALTGLEPKQLRALLAHELAHIRRYDYLVNMAQALVEILLFYHPAVWWVSRQVRVEREHACDDLALSLCNGDAVVYARALLSVEEMRSGVRGHQLALAADGGSLIARIRRIVAPKPNRTPPLAAAAVSASLLIAVGAVNLLLLKSTQAKAVNSSPTASSTQAQAGKDYQSMSKDEQAAFIAERARDIARRMSRTEYEFTPAFESEIRQYVDYYVRRIGNNQGERPGKGDVRFVFERGRGIAPLLIRTFKARNISPLIGLYIPLIESEYVNIDKPNSMGALGMFQFLPQTGERYGLTKQDLTDVEKSADAAARYIADSLGLFRDDPMKEALALLSYNRGRGKVADDLQLVTDSENRRCSICALTAARANLDKDFQSENVHYVPLFFAAAIIGENPQAFGLNTQPLSSYEQ
nr:transglycosylase SLT domain-containing protein [Acidobacteriota bacterium]